MSIYQLKPKFQGLLRPIMRRLNKRGVTANQVTLVACGISVLVALVLFMVGIGKLWLILPVWFFVRMALNAIDGMLARECEQKSDLGFVLNEMCDLVSDAALYLAFLSVSFVYPVLLIGIVLLAWLSEVVAILVFHLKGERANHGPMGKSDRAFAFSVIAIIFAYYPDSTILVNGLLGVIAAALIWTIYRRLSCVFTV